ncbi:MAG: PD40 domain-containing protein [Balneolaceae bacterium]|nr:PD40 domain-containing protein [Balneolaceae bacterium]
MKYLSNLTLILLILAVSSLQLNAQITVVGEPEVLIGGENAEYMNPRWAPNGEYLAFTSARNIGLWMVDLSTNQTKQITDETAGFGFSWSNDSESILARVSEYENRRNKHAITVYDVESGTQNRITDLRNSMPAIPKWANADQNIVLITDDSIEAFESGKEETPGAQKAVNQRFYVLKSGSIATGRIPENSTADISPFENAEYINLELSPDGSKLAFEVYGGNLYVMNIDGTGLKDLGRANRPRWSPDGEYVVAMVANDNGYQFTESNIYALGVENNARINLTEGTNLIATNPDWSPTGDRIAFDSPETGNIYVLTINKQ